MLRTNEIFTRMTAQEFEQFVMKLFTESINSDNNILFQHNEIIKTSEGNYQIDGTIRFEVMGVKYLTLVECKMYKSPISREKVQILFDKLRATGAQKGILVSTSYFQSGAIEYASTHGIALVQIIDGKLTYQVRSKDSVKISYPLNLPKYTAIVQYKINKSTMGYSDAIITNYLYEFITSIP